MRAVGYNIIFNVNHHGLVRTNAIIIIIYKTCISYMSIIMTTYHVSLCRYQLIVMTVIVMIIILILLDQTHMEQLVLERLVWYVQTVSVEWVWLMMHG